MNRVGGTERANGGWLRRLVRPLVSHSKIRIVIQPAKYTALAIKQTGRNPLANTARMIAASAIGDSQTAIEATPVNRSNSSELCFKKKHSQTAYAVTRTHGRLQATDAIATPGCVFCFVFIVLWCEVA